MESKDLYRLLGVDKNATTDEIKKQFKKLAMKCHPDRGGDSEKFKEINEAYAILSDPERRRQYDMFGTTSGMQGPGGGAEMDVNDLFSNLFGGMFPFPQGKRANKRKMAPKQYELWVSLEEVFTGASIPFNVKRKIYDKTEMSVCKDCNGTGNKVQHVQMGFMVTQTITTCPVCTGTGNDIQKTKYQEVDTKIKVTLPTGIPEGQPITVPDKGDDVPGMDVGDVVFTVRYKKHPLYEIMESPCDLSYHLEISLYEYLYGFTRPILYLNGKWITLYHPARPISLSINPSHLVKRIKDYGFQFKNHIGDLVILITIMITDAMIQDVAFKEKVRQQSPVLYEHKDRRGDERIDLSLITPSG